MKRKATVHGVAMNMEAQTSCWHTYSKLFGHTSYSEASRSHGLVFGETSIHRDPRELLFGTFLCLVIGNCETSRMKPLCFSPIMHPLHSVAQPSHCPAVCSQWCSLSSLLVSSVSSSHSCSLTCLISPQH